LKDPAKIQFTMGRLQECHSRVAKYYEMTFTDNPLEFSWQRNEVKYQQASDVDGGYILRTNLNEMDEEEIWNIYTSLTRVEAGFKALKSHLGLWPIFHQTKDRCQGHIFITVLAFHLLLWIEYRLANKAIIVPGRPSRGSYEPTATPRFNSKPAMVKEFTCEKSASRIQSRRKSAECSTSPTPACPKASRSPNSHQGMSASIL
jgi:hypothetical protein